jgi:hypothetical protein
MTSDEMAKSEREGIARWKSVAPRWATVLAEIIQIAGNQIAVLAEIICAGHPEALPGGMVDDA